MFSETKLYNLGTMINCRVASSLLLMLLYCSGARRVDEEVRFHLIYICQISECFDLYLTDDELLFGRLSTRIAGGVSNFL